MSHECYPPLPRCAYCRGQEGHVAFARFLPPFVSIRTRVSIDCIRSRASTNTARSASSRASELQTRFPLVFPLACPLPSSRPTAVDPQYQQAFTEDFARLPSSPTPRALDLRDVSTSHFGLGNTPHVAPSSESATPPLLLDHPELAVESSQSQPSHHGDGCRRWLHILPTAFGHWSVLQKQIFRPWSTPFRSAPLNKRCVSYASLP